MNKVPNQSMLAANLKFLRRFNGDTQLQLASKLDISRNQVAGIESGVIQPHSQMFLRIANHFRIHPVALIETNLVEQMQETVHVDLDTLNEKQRYILDHLQSFLDDTSQATKILEGYLALEELRSEEDNEDPTGLSNIYLDLLDLLKMGVKNNWSLLSSIGLQEE